MRSRWKPLIAVTLVATLAAACGDSSTKASTSTTTAATAATTTAAASTGASGAATTTTAATSTTRSVTDLFGTVKPATGDPVLVGFISAGKTPQLDSQIEVDVAEASVKWINERKGGIGGRPIKLVTCTDGGDAGKAGDCANELIRQNVVVAILASSGVVNNQWQPLHDSKIPVITTAASGKLTKDPDSTFALASPLAGITAVAVQAAKDVKAKKLTAVVIDVPAATDIFKNAASTLKSKYGLDQDIVPVALGTADMTPQMQKIVSGGDPGVIFVLGNDSFCIAAFNGLRTVGFKGTIATSSACMSDATRKAVPGDYLKGMRISSGTPTGDAANPSVQLYETVMKAYGKSIDLSRGIGASVFISFSTMNLGLGSMTGTVSPTTIISTMKALKWQELPGSGGLHFRCNGKAEPDNAAVCVPGILVSALDEKGQTTTFTVAFDDPIAD